MLSVDVNRSNCDSGAANILRTHYSRPYFLPDDAESSKTDWIFMGSPGFGARLHVSCTVVPYSPAVMYYKCTKLQFIHSLTAKCCD